MNKVSMVVIAIAAAMVLVAAGSVIMNGSGSSDNSSSETKIVTDMRGVEVTMPADPSRVAIVDRGFIAQVMVALDVEDRVVAQGGLNGANTPSQEKMRDTLLLNPDFLTMPNFGYPGYLPFSSEKLADSNPDLVIWKQGVTNSTSPEMQVMEEFIEEKLKVPMFVIFEPGYNGTPATLETVYDSIMMIGKIFNKEAESSELVDFTKGKMYEITSITSKIADNDKPTVMILGLTNEGAGAYAYGPEYQHGLFVEDVVGVDNIVTEYTNQIMNLETILVKNPDYIVLVDGPINPDVDVFENNPKFESWKKLDAVKNGNVCSIGQLAWWGENMMNFPSIFMIMAKEIHPELFKDVDLTEWIKQYEMELYDISGEDAQRLMFGQRLFWNNLIPDTL